MIGFGFIRLDFSQPENVREVIMAIAILREPPEKLGSTVGQWIHK